MSSGRPSASAMGADPATAASSPTRSKKRASRAGDGNSSPNPSPRGSPARGSDRKRSRRTSAESAALALATVAARATAASVRSDAGHGAVQMRGSAAPRVDGGEGGIQMLGAAAARVGGGRGGTQKHWSDADEFTLLSAAVAFRERHGRAPRLPDMAELFDSMADSISPHIDQFMVYYKIKRLKSKFQHTDGPPDRRLRHLCSILWGVGAVPSSGDDSDVGERRSVPDAAAMMPVVTEVLGEYWKTNERAMTGVSLEKGLSLLGKKEGRFLETKWRQQLDEEMQSQMQRYDLAKEVCALLTDAIKGLGP